MKHLARFEDLTFCGRRIPRSREYKARDVPHYDIVTEPTGDTCASCKKAFACRGPLSAPTKEQP